MIIPDRKKAATVIVARMHDDGHDAESPEDGEGGDLEALSKEFLDAVEAKSPKDVASAFKAMFMACDSEEDAEEGEDQGEG